MLYSSIIPFYKREYSADFATNPQYSKLLSLDERNDYAFKDSYKRIIYKYRIGGLQIPSFYIYTEKEWTGVCNIGGYFLFEDGTRLSLSNYPNFTNNIQAVNYDGSILLVSTPINLSLSPDWSLGPVILVLNVFNNVDTTVYYSDRLYITDDIHNYIELAWWNDTNLQMGKRIIPYELGYRPTCYVDALLGKPEYSFEEEIISRLGYKFVQSAVSKKVYRFSFVAPEYLCDSIRIMRICNNKKVTRYDFPNYGEEIEPMVMTMDVTWDEQGHLALVDISLEVDLVAANPSGYFPLESGDFNNDYDDDFNNQGSQTGGSNDSGSQTGGSNDSGSEIDDSNIR